MTLIAQLTVNGAPLLIGDVLLSSDIRRGLKINLPLVGDINQILANRGLPFEVSFVQKIHVFDGRIAVAWSGPLIQAERALRVLAGLSSRSDLTPADVFAELNTIDDDAIDQLQLVGLILSGVKGTIVESALFSFRIGPTHIPNFGAVFAAGTGRDAFLQLLQKADWLSQASTNEYQVAHGLLGALTNEEYRTGNTIVNRWGGGFEALTFSAQSGRFEKVSDILHTFWRVTEQSGSSIEMFPYFYKTTYWQDALLIRTASLEFGEGAKLKTNEIQLIPPLLKGIGDYNIAEIKSVNFSYRAVCCHVLIERSSSRDVLFLVDQRAGGQDVLLKVDESSGQLHITDYLPSAIKEQLNFKTEISAV